MILNCYYPSPLRQSGAVLSEIFISKQLFLSSSLRTYCLGSCDLSDQEHLTKGTSFHLSYFPIYYVVWVYQGIFKCNVAPMLNCSCWKAASVGTDKTQDTFLAVLHPPVPPSCGYSRCRNGVLIPAYSLLPQLHLATLATLWWSLTRDLHIVMHMHPAQHACEATVAVAQMQDWQNF